MQRVLSYIDAHLDDELSVEVLSQVAAFSRFHFHRQFGELFGVSVHDYVRLVRLKRASFQLAFRPALSITDIALESGYQASEAFARSFRNHFGQTPSTFRTNPDWQAWHAVYAVITEIRTRHMPGQFNDDLVQIVIFPETAVAVMAHHGDPKRIGDTIRRFIAWRRQAGLPPSRSATFNILHADPDTTPPAAYRIDLCAATPDPVRLDDPAVTAGIIPHGRCAVLRLVGHADDLRPAVSFLYADWLPRSGEELRDFPIFAQRISFFPDVAEHEAVTDIFLPLR